MQARVSGFVNVVSPHTKHVKGIHLRLVGSHRLVFPRDGSTPAQTVDEDFLVRELVVNGDGLGLTLEKGVNTSVPSFAVADAYAFELTNGVLIPLGLQLGVLVWVAQYEPRRGRDLKRVDEVPDSRDCTRVRRSAQERSKRVEEGDRDV